MPKVATTCPRCGTKAFEHLGTYSHCAECLYSEDNYFDLETAYHQVRRLEHELNSSGIIELPKKPKKPKREAS